MAHSILITIKTSKLFSLVNEQAFYDTGISLYSPQDKTEIFYFLTSPFFVFIVLKHMFDAEMIFNPTKVEDRKRKNQLKFVPIVSNVILSQRFGRQNGGTFHQKTPQLFSHGKQDQDQ